MFFALCFLKSKPPLKAALGMSSSVRWLRRSIRKNIDTRAAMQIAAQDAGLRAGLGALQQAGSALTSQYQYQ